MNLANVIERSIEVVEITTSNVERQWRWVFWPVVIILAPDEMARTKKRTSSDGIEQLTEYHIKFPFLRRAGEVSLPGRTTTITLTSG